jgi:superfamily II RNA helicase|tara:strand:- start:3227 stop:5803 length:2577 start_codon:yes stop_codon:yes gene_type:complete
VNSNLNARPNSTSLLDRLPQGSNPDEILEGFVAWATEAGLTLYPAQEEAILELLAGNHVILATPTGSGKSLVATAAHAAALARGERSAYTAPIKALVSEKFFALARDFGSDNVGMVTGDASVNPGAPIIACTAEILAHRALREGRSCDVGLVVADEFHYYADPQRGWAWQVPLLELTDTQFLLMSATLGPTTRFEDDLTERTGRPTVTVAGTERPVPLTFEYRETPLHESITELVDSDRAPIYIVHFTQKAATEKAQDLCSLDVVTREEKAEIREAVGGFRFDTPIGKDLRRFIGHGIGLHHAGLLPRYRLLIEKLAQAGLLKLICGTDTLGVGVNVPIRTVLFTQLCKYDGSTTRLLSNREFAQVAGRAGRRGFDDEGHVWAQAPVHWIENRRAEAKVAADPSRRKKLMKKKPPERGYSHWNEETFDKMVSGDPEPLDSSFDVTHQMVLNVLSRPGDGGADLRRLLTDNHEPRKRQRQHIRRAIGVYRSLRDAGIIEELNEPDDESRMVRIGVDLQDDFALHQPLSLFALEVIPELGDEGSDQTPEQHALDLLSVVESVLENPGVILAAQVNRLKTELINRLKMEGVEYEERMERLNEVRPPRPLAEFLYGTFDVFRSHHPWVGDENVQPKSVAREMYELGFNFRQYVEHHGLKRSEGVVLRYLTQAYKAVVQNVPDEEKTEELRDLEAWLGETVRQVDSSLIDEWEKLRNPDPDDTGPIDGAEPERPDVTTSVRAFRVMVRNEVFRWVQLLSRRSGEATDVLAEVPSIGDAAWNADSIREAIAPYWEDHSVMPTDSHARGGEYFVLDDSTPDMWPATQTIADPDGFNEWVLDGRVDLAASREEGRAVVRLGGIRRL